MPIILVEAAMSLLAISLLIQVARSPGPVQTIERDLSWAESPSTLYYGARDTSVLRWVCCRRVDR